MPATIQSDALLIEDLGSIDYDQGLRLQRDRLEGVLAARESGGGGGCPAGVLLLLEHDPPVITVSRRLGVRQHLVATDEALSAQGV